MNRRDAIAMVLDLDEKRLRRVLIAIIYQLYEPAGLDVSIIEEILREEEAGE